MRRASLVAHTKKAGIESSRVICGLVKFSFIKQERKRVYNEIKGERKFKGVFGSQEKGMKRKHDTFQEIFHPLDAS